MVSSFLTATLGRTLPRAAEVQQESSSATLPRVSGAPLPRLARLVRRTALYDVHETDARAHLKRLIAGGPAEEARFREEGERVARLAAHPGVLGVRELARTHQLLETFEAYDLTVLLGMLRTAGAYVPPAVALAIAREVAAALAHAHEAGLVHGFLALPSVLVSAQGRIKVTDFRLGAEPGRAEGDDLVALGALMSAVCAALEPLDREALRARAAAGQMDLSAPILAPDLAALVEGLTARRLRPARAVVDAASRALEQRGAGDVPALIAAWMAGVVPRMVGAQETLPREALRAPPPQGGPTPLPVRAPTHVVTPDEDEPATRPTQGSSHHHLATSAWRGRTGVAGSAGHGTRPGSTQSGLGLEGTVLDGRYQILEELAVGGMGRIYRAVQLAVGREVVIKTVLADAGVDSNEVALSRFENEARLISQLRHPNTLRLYDFGHVDGELYLVTELLHGETIEERLADGPIDPRTVVRWLIDVADALAEAHGKGIVHRDIKPGNLFLDRVGDRELIKILDFGLAKTAHGPAQTAVGFVVGSPTYMSPEQGSGLPLGPPSDLYSLGVTAFEMLTARVPFDAAQPHALLLQHRHDAPPAMASLVPPVEVPPELEALVRALLAKDPAARPRSAGELRDRLQALDLVRATSSAGGGRAPPSADGDALIGALIHNHRIVSLLGAGAASRVYAGRHEILGREVAIKVLTDAGLKHESAQKRLRREAMILARIAHPAVVAVLDCGVLPDGAPYVVLERIHGRTLRQVLDAEQRLSPGRAAHIARQIASALATAHGQGVVHRDLKPSNVMVLADDAVKVVDFGIARMLDPDDERTRLTRNQALLGSPSFMAPEQIEAPSAVGPAADLYALGCTIYVMLTGHAPFRGSVSQVLEQQRSAPPPALPPAGGLEVLVMRLLAKRPADRPADAGAVVAAIDALEITRDATLPLGDVTRLLDDPPPRASSTASMPGATAPGGLASADRTAAPARGVSWPLLAAAGAAVLVAGVALGVSWVSRGAEERAAAEVSEAPRVAASPGAVVAASPGAVAAPSATPTVEPSSAPLVEPSASPVVEPSAAASVTPRPTASPSDARKRPSPPSAAPFDAAPLRARLDASLRTRGLTAATLPPELVPDHTAALRALDARDPAPAEAAVARVEAGIRALPFDAGQVKARLDRLGKTLSQRAPSLPEATVRALEDRYLRLATRLSPTTPPDQLAAILRDAAQIERELGP